MKAKIPGIFGAVMLAASVTAQAGVIGTPCGQWGAVVDGDTVSSEYNDYDAGEKTCNYELNFLAPNSIGTPVPLTVDPGLLGLAIGDVIHFTTFNVGTINNFTPVPAGIFQVTITTIDSGSMAMFTGTPVTSRANLVDLTQPIRG